MQLRTIVAAVQVHDDLARAVVLTAKSIARYDAEIHVVSAWPIVATAVAGFAAEMGAIAGPMSQEAILADREARKADEASLKTFVREIAPHADVFMLDGEPGEAVTAYARTIDADIIVAGSHQKGFWGALIAGAASRDVVRDAHCGVFLVTKPFAEKVLAGALA